MRLQRNHGDRERYAQRSEQALRWKERRKAHTFRCMMAGPHV
jgi:hypothetical protein